MHAAAILLFAVMSTGNVPPAGGPPAAGPAETKAARARAAAHHRHRRHRVVYASPIKGSHESLVRQNQRVEDDDLERIQDDAQLQELTESKDLVGLPENRTVTVAGNLPDERRYCRPWTRSFLLDFAGTHYAAFRAPLQVNSAVRTVEYQEELRRKNHNAAPEEGDVVSPHLTGATVDISKRGMGRKQLTWIRNYLLKLQNSGVLDVEEEFRQRVFHITVYRIYEDARLQRLLKPRPKRSAE